jgi:hypothetical protein
MNAAEDAPLAFHSVSYDAATAVVTTGREPLDRAFETVKGVRCAIHRDDK